MIQVVEILKGLTICEDRVNYLFNNSEAMISLIVDQ